MNHKVNLDLLDQFIAVVNAQVPPRLINHFIDRLNETHCPISFDTLPHLTAATSGCWTLLTVETGNG